MARQTIKCAAPDAFDKRQQAAFIELVKSGGEVAERTLTRNVPQAERLAFLWLDDALCGVAALKNPQSSYREGFLKKSGVAVEGRAFPFELGYVFITKPAQGRGYSRKLVEALLADYRHDGIFTTSHTTNEAMHKTLARYGFERAGKPWNGKDSGEMIQLFLRRGEQSSC